MWLENYLREANRWYFSLERRCHTHQSIFISDIRRQFVALTKLTLFGFMRPLTHVENVSTFERKEKVIGSCALDSAMPNVQFFLLHKFQIYIAFDDAFTWILFDIQFSTLRWVLRFWVYQCAFEDILVLSTSPSWRNIKSPECETWNIEETQRLNAFRKV